MQAMSVIRNWQIDQLEKARLVLSWLLQNVPQADARQYRDGDDGWTIQEVVGHLRDYEEIFVERAQLTLSQDMPHLHLPNADALAKEREYNSDTLEDALQSWVTHRTTLIELLRGVDDEAQWERAANHPTRGRFTLHDQLFLTAWHDMNHFAQIARIAEQIKR